MVNKLLQLIMFLTFGTSLILYSQNKTGNINHGGRESSVIFDKNLYNKIVPIENNVSRSNTDLFFPTKPNSEQAWVNITTENFEGTVPGSGWSIYAQAGYTNAYWGKLLLSDNIHYAGWCAASGPQASIWGQGYLNNMRTWMIYGPFDLTDATDASLEFLYISDCEPSFDSFGWYASLDGSNYNGYFLSDSTSNYIFQSKIFDLKTVPTLGNLTGKSGVYIAFFFQSDSTVSNYGGAIIDEIVLKKFTSSTYPSTIAISKSFGFTNITSSSSYRMLGLPGDINLPLSITGTRKTDWNAFYDNGAASNYLVEYDGSANFNFKPGNGFWILSKNNISINAQVNSVTLTSGSYSIPLHTGWNIISNPFERSTNWAAVQTANGLAENTVIYDWGGTWTNPTSFIPYKAYYFNNAGALPSLKIPYDPAGTLGKPSGENEFQISGENDIKLFLLSNGEESSKAFIGFNSESTNDFDNADYFAPPGDFEEARIVIRNSNLSTNYKFLMKESRREIRDGQIYNLEVKNLTGQNLILKIDGMANYKNYLFYLVDERLNNGIKLSGDLEIKIPANVKNNNYQLLIGTQQFIEANKGNLVPSEFALYQNYPNPFNPTTVIRYSVPKSSLVSIKLFDLLGNEVMTLLNEEKSPGNYEVEVNASKLASGVYIYKMSASAWPSQDGQSGLFTDIRKMILLR
jgi:hypothetical protein